MNRRMPFLLAATLLLASPVAGLAQNAQVMTRGYVEHEVIALTGRADYESTILFGDGERIENVAIGQSGAWQVTPNRRANLLFLKPVAATAAKTNMTVVTDRHTYLFELNASAKVQPLYLLRFSYPELPPVPPPSPAAEPEPALVSTAATLPVDRLNFAWSMGGARALHPERCFDDGKSVYLAWGAGRALPAVLSIGPDGKTEGPVNYTANGDYLVIEGFHQRLILRSGKAMASLETRRTPPADAAITTGTE